LPLIAQYRSGATSREANLEKSKLNFHQIQYRNALGFLDRFIIIQETLGLI
jgi:hypothetical protein